MSTPTDETLDVPAWALLQAKAIMAEKETSWPTDDWFELGDDFDLNLDYDDATGRMAVIYPTLYEGNGFYSTDTSHWLRLL